MALKDFYSILGVSSSATAEEINNAYRRLAKQYHPDRNPGNKYFESRFKEISEAYNTLCNEEKRNKYDLKFLYTSNARAGKKQQGAYTNPRPRYQARKERPPSKSEKRSVRLIFASVVGFIIVITVMIILNPEDEDSAAVNKIVSQIENDPINRIPDEKAPLINDADSPYDPVFGTGVEVDEARNTISLINSEASEVVACLVQKDPPHRTIRNEYFGPGLTYKIVGVPNGTYYLKVYFGKHWNPNKLLAGGKAKGGFDEELGFYCSDKPKDLIVIDQHSAGENLVYSNYEVELKKILDDKSRKITAEAFFR